MTEPNNYLFDQGTLFVSPGGGSAPEPLTPGDDGQVLTRNPSASNGLGVEWSDNGTGDVEGPSSAVDSNFAAFNTTTGKLIKDSLYSPSSFSLALTASGAAKTKGTFTLTGGASGDIASTAVAAGSVIVLCITTLGTVAAPKPMLVTKTNGTKFTITSSDGTDTSSGTWAILN